MSLLDQHAKVVLQSVPASAAQFGHLADRHAAMVAGVVEYPQDEPPRITLDPQVLTGKPVIRGTRLSVEFVIGLMADGWSEADILANYPGLAREDISACLAYARDILSSETRVPERGLTLRFLADENFPGAAVRALEAAGYDVAWVRASTPGATDPDVLAWAVQDGGVLLTSTRISANWRSRRHCLRPVAWSCSGRRSRSLTRSGSASRPSFRLGMTGLAISRSLSRVASGCAPWTEDRSAPYSAATVTAAASAAAISLSISAARASTRPTMCSTMSWPSSLWSILPAR